MSTTTTFASLWLSALVLLSTQQVHALDCRGGDEQLLNDIRVSLSIGDNLQARKKLSRVEAQLKTCKEEDGRSPIYSSVTRSLATFRAVLALSDRDWDEARNSIETLKELETSEFEKEELISLQYLLRRLKGEHKGSDEKVEGLRSCIQEIRTRLLPAKIRSVCRDLTPLPRRSFWNVVSELLHTGRSDPKELNYVLDSSSRSPLHREFIRALLRADLKELPALPLSRRELDADCSCDAKNKVNVTW